jgi:hypothetical protein
MWDIAYTMIALVFFAAMLWYVRACERLGGEATTRHNADDQPAGGWRTGGY